MLGWPLGDGHVAPLLRTSPLAVIELLGVRLPASILQLLIDENAGTGLVKN
ncbi:hypothetical protein D3C84_685990 [compost metagenome]